MVDDGAESQAATIVLLDENGKNFRQKTYNSGRIKIKLWNLTKLIN